MGIRPETERKIAQVAKDMASGMSQEAACKKSKISDVTLRKHKKAVAVVKKRRKFAKPTLTTFELTPQRSHVAVLLVPRAELAQVIASLA